HLEEAEGGSDDERILLRLDGPCLERVVEAVDVDGGGLFAGGAGRVGGEVAFWRADLLNGEIGEAAHGVLRPRGIAEDVLEAAPRHEVDALGGAFPLQMRAEIAIERGIDIARAAEGEGNALHVGGGTTSPKMPPISVKKSSSPARSMASACGSPPAMPPF